MKTEEQIEEALKMLWEALEDKNKPILTHEDNREKEFSIYTERLMDKGLIQFSNDTVQFTTKGKKAAEHTIRRHRLSERLFFDVLDTKKDDMEKGACRLEHIVKKEIEDKICELLGHPKTCPHGKPIPPGKCCMTTEQFSKESVVPLARLKKGEKAVIAYLKTGDAKKMQKLMGMGIMPGSHICLNHAYPSFVFSVEYSQYAIDADLAKAIVVRRDVLV